ncbi:MAG: ATP-binding protein [Richelia sp. RM2_1_2]|nr:ATP-binding protein [Richelia sp. RM2_1_2]
MRQADLEQPELIMLVGIPGSGKSTWIRNHMNKHPEKNYVVISSDDIIEELGAAEGLSYTEAFSKYVGQATSMMKSKAIEAFRNRRNIIWDQTNLTPKTRKGKIQQAQGYRRIAVVWNLTDAEWSRRFNKRKTEIGKDIPKHVLDNMQKDFTMPSKSEGFEQIIVIRN